MAIAEHLRDELDRAGLPLRERPGGLPAVRMPNIGEASPRPYAQAERIAEDPEYGRIVCFCERVTRGEIRDAAASADPAGRPRRAAPAHAGSDGSLPGVLLRSPGPRVARRAHRPGRRRDPGAAPMSARDATMTRPPRSPWSAPGRPGWPRRRRCARQASTGSWCSSARPSRAGSRATPIIRASAFAISTVPCRGRATRRRSPSGRSPAASSLRTEAQVTGWVARTGGLELTGPLGRARWRLAPWSWPRGAASARARRGWYPARGPRG